MHSEASEFGVLYRAPVQRTVSIDVTPRAETLERPQLGCPLVQHAGFSAQRLKARDARNAHHVPTMVADVRSKSSRAAQPTRNGNAQHAIRRRCDGTRRMQERLPLSDQLETVTNTGPSFSDNLITEPAAVTGEPSQR